METVLDAGSPAAAESSPAALQVPTDSAQYAEWRQTGKLPEAKPAASAKEAKPEGTKPKESSRSTAPASEPGDNPPESKRSKAAQRLDEILDDLKRAGLTPEELKTYKRQQQQELKKDPAPPAATPETSSKPAGTERPQKPKFEDYKTAEEYEAAKDQYDEALTDWKVEQKLVQERQKEAQRQAQTALNEKLASARQRYGEAADSTIQSTAKAIFTDNEVPGAVKALMDQSPVLVDLMYVLGSGTKGEDLGALVALAKSDPGAAIRKIVLLERLVQEELTKSPAGEKGEKPEGSTPGRDASGQFTAAKTPKNSPSEAPPPPKEVSGRGAAPPDEITSAVQAAERGENPFLSYRNAANRRDFERRKGR